MADDFYQGDQILKDVRFLLVLRWCVRFKHIFSLTVRFRNSVRKANGRDTSLYTAHYTTISRGTDLVLVSFDREINSLSRDVETKKLGRELA